MKNYILLKLLIIEENLCEQRYEELSQGKTAEEKDVLIKQFIVEATK
jgi:hypothetical protein